MQGSEEDAALRWEDQGLKRGAALETSLEAWVPLGYGREGDRENIILGLLLGILPDMGAALIPEMQGQEVVPGLSPCVPTLGSTICL